MLPSAHGPRMVEASNAGPATPRLFSQKIIAKCEKKTLTDKKIRYFSREVPYDCRSKAFTLEQKMV